MVLGEAIRRLGSAPTREPYSALGEWFCLVVDLSGPSHPSASELDAARRGLAQLACPSIAVGIRAAGAAATRLLPDFDIAVEDLTEAQPIVETIGRCPIASLALVQVLRHSEGLDVHEGLVAESLVYSTLQSGPEFAAWREARRPPRARTPTGASPDDGPAVRVERDGDAMRLVLDRPARRNAFSIEMRDALVEALMVASVDPGLRRIFLMGSGPAFCSGGDLDEFGSLPDPATAHAVRSSRNASRLVASCAERLEARVHGACVGAGCEIPAFASRVVAAPDAVFRLPEVGMGLVPGAGGTVSLPRRIGRQRTAYMALSQLDVEAETALSWGLVDAIAGD